VNLDAEFTPSSFSSFLCVFPVSLTPHDRRLWQEEMSYRRSLEQQGVVDLKQKLQRHKISIFDEAGSQHDDQRM
jgi:hypothetical protein